MGTGFVVVMGNLGVVHLLRNKLIELGDVSFASTLPGFPALVSLLHGVYRVVVDGVKLTMRPETWYWHPTRIIPNAAGNAIAEFPAFTFLYGDLHAHMIAFPITLFAVVVALNWANRARPSWGSLLLGGLIIGSLRPTNTWDYPTYLLLGMGGLALGAWRAASARGVAEQENESWARIAGRLAAEICAVIGLSLLLFLPYSQHYVAGYTSVAPWEGGRTPVGIYLWIYAGLLLPLVTAMVTKAVARVTEGESLWPSAAAVGGASLLIGGVMWVLKVPVAAVALPVAALAAFLFLNSVDSCSASRGTVRADSQDRETPLLWLMVGGAMILSLAVEVLVLEGDIGRMNTVFKFYLQVWVLLAVAAGVSLAWLWDRSQRWGEGWRQLWWAAMAALAVGGALFLPCGLYGRVVDRMAPQTGATLNGMAFMKRAVIHDGPDGALREIALASDHRAIRWMQEEIDGSPVILEGLGRREYLWANRVSVYTGLPAVAGWRWHQVQQRAGVGGDMVEWQRAEVDACYNTVEISEAQAILARQGVGYVYVGAYERAYYAEPGLAKFDLMADLGLLRLVYDDEGVRIYEVDG